MATGHYICYVMQTSSVFQLVARPFAWTVYSYISQFSLKIQNKCFNMNFQVFASFHISFGLFQERSWSLSRRKTAKYLITLPGVIVDDLIIRSDEGVIDNLQIRVDHHHSGQLQTMNGVTLRGHTRYTNTIYIVLTAYSKPAKYQTSNISLTNPDHCLYLAHVYIRVLA